MRQVDAAYLQADSDLAIGAIGATRMDARNEDNRGER